MQARPQSSRLRVFVLSCALVLGSGGLALAQPPGTPQGWVFMGCHWVPPEMVYGDGATAGTPWPGGIVPYRFSISETPPITAQEREWILRSMAEIEAVCNVNFVLWLGPIVHPNLLTFRRNPGTLCSPTSCSVSSGLGMVGGEQFISVGSNLWDNKYHICHEIMHALGFIHEHQRPDRNNFVNVNCGNISNTCGSTPPAWCPTASCAPQFTMLPGALTWSPYDYESIMHYGPSQFSSGGNTLTATNPPSAQSLMGNRVYMSLGDSLSLRTRYGNPVPPTLSNVSPSTTLALGSSLNITLTGTKMFEGSPNNNGVQGTVVLWDGFPVNATWVERNSGGVTTMTAVVPAILATPGCHTVSVENEAFWGGGGESNALQVTLTTLTSVSTGEWRGNFEGDRFGYGVAGIGDVNGDGADDVVMGAPSYLADRGQVLCYSGATGAVLWAALGENVDDDFGYAVARTADLTNDGIPDVLVGAPGRVSDTGAIYVLDGTDGSQVSFTLGIAIGGRLGASVCDAGDMDQDGVTDRAAGAPFTNNSTGRVVIFRGSNGQILYSRDGENAGDLFGFAVAGGGNLGFDGIPDLVVGAPQHDGNGSASGRIYVISGQTGNWFATRTGDATQDQLGSCVAVVPSVEGYTGLTIVAGAPEPGFLGSNTGTGYVRLYRANANPNFATIRDVTGSSTGDRFGRCVSPAGDLDQDGIGDYAVGAYQSTSGPGYVRAFAGVDDRVLGEWTGTSTNSQFGIALAFAGDVDQDARLDLIVGAPRDDQSCNDAGMARILSAPVAPNPFKVMIKEVSWGNPDGCEIANMSAATVDLSDWQVIWDDSSVRRVGTIPAGTSIAPGEIIVVREAATGGTFTETFAGTQVIYPFGIFGLGTSSQELDVSLVTPSGIVIDEVRISDTSGQADGAGNGGAFTGLAMRGTVTTGAAGCVERIWGLDSNSGADWTEQPVTSMGLENLSNGARGTDPRPFVSLLLNETDDNPDLVEILVPAGTSPLDLHGWQFLCDASQGGFPVLTRPFPDTRIVGGGTFIVLGESPAPPAEFVAGPGAIYIDLVENIPWVSSEYTGALYDAYGRLVDLFRTTDGTTNLVHNHPRLPSAWEDFLGAGLRYTSSGDGAMGRANGTDTDTGADWRPVFTRTMGAPNGGFGGPTGHGDAIDVRINAGSDSRLTVIINGGAALGNSPWGIVWGIGHANGGGPLMGLPASALPTLADGPLGVLDPEGSFRMDFDNVPPGLDIDSIYWVLPAGGGPALITKVLEYDS